MFSALTRDQYSGKKAKAQEGLLDVIAHAGVPVHWRDNNSSCKGVCDRVSYESIQSWTLPEVCNSRECFDLALLHQLNEKLATMSGSQAAQAKVLVLHQKGSHGPDYYNRYPASAERFKPACQSNQLQACSSQELINAFDNTIAYTDTFLASTIHWLKTQETDYNPLLVYVSDHGESLGENGLYLHGMPYVLAPDAQKHVPMLMWFSQGFKTEQAVDQTCLANLQTQTFSHDNIFHTLLGLLSINAQVYDKTLDISSDCRGLTASQNAPVRDSSTSKTVSGTFSSPQTNEQD
jgi:lipid A ethanolaminephosphotransferase